MNGTFRRWTPRRVLSLMLVAVIGGALWRWEIELRWGGSMEWLFGFHYAAIGIGLVFGAWLYWAVPCSTPRLNGARTWLAFLGVLAAYHLYDWAFSTFFGPRSWGFSSAVVLPIVAFFSIPLCLCLLAQYFSERWRWLHWLTTPLLFGAALIVPVLILQIRDPIAAIKSGAVIVGLLIAAGLPFIDAATPRGTSTAASDPR